MAIRHLLFLIAIATVYWATTSVQAWAFSDEYGNYTVEALQEVWKQEWAEVQCSEPSTVHQKHHVLRLTRNLGVQLSNLKNLNHMDLSFNSFTGDLPTRFESSRNSSVLFGGRFETGPNYTAWIFPPNHMPTEKNISCPPATKSHPTQTHYNKEKPYAARLVLTIVGLIVLAALAVISRSRWARESKISRRTMDNDSEFSSFSTIFAVKAADHVILGADSRSTTRQLRTRRDDFIKIRKILPTGLYIAVSGRSSTLVNLERRLKEIYGDYSPFRVSTLVERVVQLLSLEPPEDHCTVILAGRARSTTLELVRIHKSNTGAIDITNNARFLLAGSGSVYIDNPDMDEIDNGDWRDNLTLVSFCIERAIQEDRFSGGRVLTLAIKENSVFRFIRAPCITSSTGFIIVHAIRKSPEQDADTDGWTFDSSP